MKYALPLLLICFALAMPGWAVPQPATPETATPGVTTEQIATVKAILATIKENIEASQVAAEDALVKEGKAILPALLAAPVADNGKPDVPALTRQQAVVVREAVVRLTWDANPRAIVKQALAARAAKAGKKPSELFIGAPELITDTSVISTFPGNLFYVVSLRAVPEPTPALLVVNGNAIASTAATPRAAPGAANDSEDGLPITWIADPPALQAFFLANAPALPAVKPDYAGPVITKGKPNVPGSEEVSAAAYCWVRLDEMLNPGVRLLINPDVKVQVEMAMTNRVGAQPRSWITGKITATPPANSGFTGSLTATLSFGAESRKLEGITTENAVKPNQTAVGGGCMSPPVLEEK